MNWNPWQELNSVLHVTLMFDCLPDGEKGRWYPDRETIVLDERLDQAGRRCTLTHELRHRARGHGPCTTDREHARQERMVEEEAARLLIPLQRLADVLLWTDHEAERIEELWVDQETYRTRISTLTEHEHRYLQRRLAELEQVA